MISEVLTVKADMENQIGTEWADLCDEGASNAPFFRPEWFKTFAKNFDKRMELVTVKLHGRLRAVLPVEKKWGDLHGILVRKLQGVFNLNTQRFDLVHGPCESERRDVVNSVWKALSQRPDWDVIEFRLVRNDSWLVDVLQLAERDGFRTGVWQMDAAPYIALDESGDMRKSAVEFFSGGRKHLGRELDRRLRRLRESGNVEFIVSHGASSATMSRYFALEAGGWKGRAGTAVTDDSRVEKLHKEFAELLSARKSLIVYELTFDGETIAMSLNIREGRQMIHWKTSYDERFRRYAPGNLLFRKFLTDCIDQEIAEIDFLSPSTANKRVWATGEREHVALYIFRRGLVGSVLWRWKFGLVGWLRKATIRPAYE